MELDHERPRVCTCGGWVMSNGLCACGLPIASKHVHRPATNADGRRICMDCNEILVEPILDSSDERLESVGPISTKRKLEPIPLPVLLIDMWDRGDAPVAPYVEDIGSFSHPHNYQDWLDIFVPWVRK